LEKLYEGFNARDFTPVEEIAEVVYESATDGKDKLRYVAGADAVAAYALRQQVGDEAFRKGIDQRFFGGLKPTL
jgi:predicted metal-dependent hydrolase